MSIKLINESFDKLIEKEKMITESQSSLEKNMLTIVDLMEHSGQTNLKAYEYALQDAIEKEYPGKSWWEVTSVNIFWDLFNNRDPRLTVQNIINDIEGTSIEEDYKDTHMMLGGDGSEIYSDEDLENIWDENHSTDPSMKEYKSFDIWKKDTVSNMEELDESKCMSEEKEISNFKGTLGNVLEKHFDELNKLTSKEDIFNFLNKIKPEVNQKNYLKRTIQNLNKKRDFISALTYLYDIIQKGHNEGVITEARDPFKNWREVGLEIASEMDRESLYNMLLATFKWMSNDDVGEMLHQNGYVEYDNLENVDESFEKRFKRKEKSAINESAVNNGIIYKVFIKDNNEYLITESFSDIKNYLDEYANQNPNFTASIKKLSNFKFNKTKWLEYDGILYNNLSYPDQESKVVVYSNGKCIDNLNGKDFPTPARRHIDDYLIRLTNDINNYKDGYIISPLKETFKVAVKIEDILHLFDTQIEADQYILQSPNTRKIVSLNESINEALDENPINDWLGEHNQLYTDFKAKFNYLDESLKESLARLLEARISDEDKHDSGIIRSMIDKMQVRSNAKFTDEEKAVMDKYGISRDNWNRKLMVANRDLNPNMDGDRRYGWNRKDGYYKDGTTSKINYADRARKLGPRKETQVAGDGSHVFYQNRDFNRHGMSKTPLIDRERDFANADMQKPVNDMKRELDYRARAKNRIANADAEREKRMAAAQAAYNKAKANADMHYKWDTEDSEKQRDSAQANIDKLLKR